MPECLDNVQFMHAHIHPHTCICGLGDCKVARVGRPATDYKLVFSLLLAYPP